MRRPEPMCAAAFFAVVIRLEDTASLTAFVVTAGAFVPERVKMLLVVRVAFPFGFEDLAIIAGRKSAI